MLLFFCLLLPNTANLYRRPSFNPLTKHEKGSSFMLSTLLASTHPAVCQLPFHPMPSSRSYLTSHVIGSASSLVRLSLKPSPAPVKHISSDVETFEVCFTALIAFASIKQPPPQLNKMVSRLALIRLMVGFGTCTTPPASPASPASPPTFLFVVDF